MSSMNEPGYKEMLDKLHEVNDVLYQAIIHKLHSGAFIRDDVLDLFTEIGNTVDTDDDFLYQFIMLVENEKVSPGWFVWFNVYHNDYNFISPADVVLTIQTSIAKDVPIDIFKRAFDNHESNILDVQKKIADAMDSTIHENDPDDGVSAVTSVSMDNPPAVSNDTENFAERSADNVGVFDNLMVLITAGKDSGSDLRDIEASLNGYINSLQSFVRDLTVFTNNVIRGWENDRREIDRLKALYDIEKKLLSGQQEKIISMDHEITRLTDKLRSAEKGEMRREELYKKIGELRTLAGVNGNDFDSIVNGADQRGAL